MCIKRLNDLTHALYFKKDKNPNKQISSLFICAGKYDL